MKVHFRKPADNRADEMEAIKSTVRRRSACGLITATFAYPAGHPMRKYRDKKRALKQERAAKLR